MKDNIKNQPQPAIWNPDKALEGWMDGRENKGKRK